MDDKIQVGNGSDFDIEVRPGLTQHTRVFINRKTHSIRWEENEEESILCVEPKEEKAMVAG